MMILRVILILTSFFAGSQLLSATTYKLTQVTTVADGNMYVFVESKHALTIVNSSAIQSTTSFNTTGLEGNESYVWTLESATGGYYMKMSNDKYLNNTSRQDWKAGR